MSDETRQPIKRSGDGNRRYHFVVFLTLLLISACTSSQSPIDLAGVFPTANAIPGWSISQNIETYNRDTLFNLVDGQADSFFAYGFEKVAVQRYQNDTGITLHVEIWQLATPADAYGLFSAGRSGSAVAIGNGGDSDPGRRLAFWQNRTFVSLNADEAAPDEILQTFAQTIATRLPTGGEIPAIMNRLPPSGLIEGSSIFFHEEMSIQMEVWLGGENILGLSQATDGAVGRYQMGDTLARLMVIEYPSSSQAIKGLKALQSSSDSGLAAAGAHGKLLGAVFGDVEAAQAQALLEEVLK